MYLFINYDVISFFFTADMSEGKSEVLTTKCRWIPDAAEWFPQHDNRPRTVDETLRQLTHHGQQQHRHLLDVLQLPSLQIPQFDGNPLHYHNFVAWSSALADASTARWKAHLVGWPLTDSLPTTVDWESPPAKDEWVSSCLTAHQHKIGYLYLVPL